jgi:hypothetical protein
VSELQARVAEELTGSTQACNHATPNAEDGAVIDFRKLDPARSVPGGFLRTRSPLNVVYFKERQSGYLLMRYSWQFFMCQAGAVTHLPIVTAEFKIVFSSLELSGGGIYQGYMDIDAPAQTSDDGFGEIVVIVAALAFDESSADRFGGRKLSLHGAAVRGNQLHGRLPG